MVCAVCGERKLKTKFTEACFPISHSLFDILKSDLLKPSLKADLPENTKGYVLESAGLIYDEINSE